MATDIEGVISLKNITGPARQVYDQPVDPNRAALVMVDIHGEPHKPWINQAVFDKFVELLAAARRNGIKVVHIRNICWMVDGSDLENHKKRAVLTKRSRLPGQEPLAANIVAALKGAWDKPAVAVDGQLWDKPGSGLEAGRMWDTPEAQFRPETGPIEGEPQFWKTGASAFPWTSIAASLRNMQVSDLVFVGLLSDGCLLGTAVDAIGEGFNVNIASDAVLGTTRPSHLGYLRLMDQYWARVRTTEDYLNEFSGTPQKNPASLCDTTELTENISLKDLTECAHDFYPEPVDPPHTALILVNMTTWPGESVNTELQGVVGQCERLLDGARSNGIKVVHVALGAETADGTDMSPYCRRLIEIARAKGEDLLEKFRWVRPYPPTLGKLAPIRGEMMLKTLSRCAFSATGLAGLLANMNIRYLVLAGRDTVGTLGLTAIQASWRGFAATLADGACMSQGERDGHLFILREFDQMRGRLRTVSEIVKEFQGDQG